MTLSPRGNSVPAAEFAHTLDTPRTARIQGHLSISFDRVGTLLLALVAVALHVRFITSVGGLWRDETNSVNLATLPSFADTWRFLDYDSFPVLFFAVLRGWTTIFGANDVALRALGLLTGLGILAALWANARAFGVRWPLLAYALVGLNPMFIRYGDSTRAYGLGILLILLTMRSFWRLVEDSVPTSWRRILPAAILGLLSVQCLYYNCVLLLAIAAGASAVAAARRHWRTVAIVLGLGLLAAASMLPYVPMIRRMGEWTFLVSYPADFAWLWKRVGEVIGSPSPVLIWLWTILFLIAVVLVATRFVKLFAATNQPDRATGAIALPAAVTFAAVAMIVGVAGYALFLRVLNYYTQPWYYITLVGFAACTLEAIFGEWSTKRTPTGSFFRGARRTAAVLLLLAAFPAWQLLETRHTNVDLLAAQLLPLAQSGDVILVPRWECAITLARYYRGPAEIITLPPIGDHRFHRYDLVLQDMKTPEAVRPVLDRLEGTLRSGHRVFLAGTLPFANSTVAPPSLPPLRRDDNGQWHGGPYYSVWDLQAAQFLRSHSTGAARVAVAIPNGARVQAFEDLELGYIEGWR
ncbi:MAG: hypothetical protein M3Z22_00405 [Verrucomicrobiota bacterium]|nr:hypothetical protein [Verrucomicrobiota bacterium]